MSANLAMQHATSAACAAAAQPPRRQFGLLPGCRARCFVIAFAALALGVLVYAVARPHAAAFLPAAWHRPVLAIASLQLASGFVGALPSFLHALAMSLLIALAAQAAAPRGRGGCCAAVCAVEFGFEIAQHPAVAAALLGSAVPSPGAGGLDRALRSYLMHGTFDRLDLVAAGAGCLAAFAVLARSAREPRISPGAHHVAA